MHVASSDAGAMASTEMPGPTFTGTLSDELLDPAFWSKIVPFLGTSPVLDLGAVQRRRIEAQREREIVESMRKDGFFSVEALLPRERMDRMRRGVEAVRARFGHEVFSLMFDEFWCTLAEVSALLALVTGSGSRAVPLPYVNYVPPGHAGFEPHRDRHDDPLTVDGMPNMVTAWISLTDATPERACLALLPASRDKNFPDRLASREVEDLRDIRAVPVPVGSLICFNQALLHWGTRNAAGDCRVSFAFEVERDGIATARRPPVELDQALDLSQRAGFVGATVGMLSKSNVTFTAADLDAAQLMCERVYGSEFDYLFVDE
jgi:ectoine hydroxylase-related dioxygenase (phytanoyl-CoA dioxygenase family)